MNTAAMYTDLDEDENEKLEGEIDTEVYIDYEGYAIEGRRVDPGYRFNQPDGRYKVVRVNRHYDCHQPKNRTEILNGLGGVYDTNMVKFEVGAIKI
jgi:hypothetical protein